ncbi:hypothetical protein [Proteus sp. TSJ240517]|uniref:hypothetical protein n=1 Tax=Proteus sp. TSJ240517 TaxID=3399622 RepID=UPI003A4D4F53
MTINDLKAINDRYMADKRRKAIIERAEVKANVYESAKRLFQLAKDNDYVKRSDGYIDVILTGCNVNVFLNLTNHSGLFKKCGDKIYQHMFCNKLLMHEKLNHMGGVNFARIILS